MNEKEAIAILQEIRGLGAICWAFNLKSEQQKRDKRLQAIDKAIRAMREAEAAREQNNQPKGEGNG